VRQLTENDLKQIQSQYNSLNARIAFAELDIKKLKASGESREDRIQILEAQVAVLREEMDMLLPILEDPILWDASFNMRGNDIDLNGGELQSSAGWVRIQPHWDDLRSPGTGVTASGAKKPSFLQFRGSGAGSTGAYAWLFPPSIERELFFTVQMPHAWVEGTEVQPHIHWSPNDNSAGTVVWALEYTFARVGEAFPLTTTTYAYAEATGEIYDHLIGGFEPDIDMTGKTLSSQIVGRLYRDSTAPEDDYGLGAWFHEMDIHFQLDGLGSNNTLTKSAGEPDLSAGGGSVVGGGGDGGKTPPSTE
jgi:hypothetical protein